MNDGGHKTMIRYISTFAMILLLAAGTLACGGGGSAPVDPGGQNNGFGATLVGRVLDREGTPSGAPWVTVKLTTASGGQVAPALQPENSGPNAGRFQFAGLPTGIPLTLEIELFQVSLGRNLGWIQQVTLSGSGTFDLGDITLENDFLDNGWNAYGSKDYSLAELNFKRAFQDRFLQAEGLTYSSSAYTGLGWVYAKRGKNNQTGLYYIDDDGNWVDTINSYEWDQALINFDKATINRNDADGWLGMAGTYVTLLGKANKDPIIIGTEVPFYAFVEYYFDNAEVALENALDADPDLNCSHDDVSADDVQATLLFLRWIQGASVSPEEATSLAATGDLNQGSQQLLSVLPDLIQYNPYPLQ